MSISHAPPEERWAELDSHEDRSFWKACIYGRSSYHGRRFLNQLAGEEWLNSTLRS